MISGIKRTSRVNPSGYTNILFICQSNINNITCNFGTFPIILDSTAKANDNHQIGQTLHRRNINITYFQRTEFPTQENISDTETSCVGKMLITAERTSVIEQTSVVYKTSTSGRPSREREPSSLSQSP